VDAKAEMGEAGRVLLWGLWGDLALPTSDVIPEMEIVGLAAPN
jgi:hypothetical protein